MKTDKEFLTKAIELLKQVDSKGWRQEGMLVDTTWALPMELLWDVEGFLERYHARDDKPSE